MISLSCKPMPHPPARGADPSVAPGDPEGGTPTALVAVGGAPMREEQVVASVWVKKVGEGR